ncbi:flagellar hook-length control protein FliK [Sphingopyxis sp. BSN-002]|uniref:flagellar hook-length control protein FliK n=1 Tax=Sphingopyxis sp. BSN-002 TaxID=2911495 RepID=UPI001EDC7C54|nr:flagellar hook-length control protein FliK [Sphingopyxis sp. BSN-002]UKK83191.1 flagellar hook-length control protein FliK [Sphingopyxis sp. BSN-002]
MMASLPQTPAQTGLASILAALGQTAPAGTATDAPGFEQLFASLPEAATTETPTMTIPNAANPAAGQPGIQTVAAAGIMASGVEAQAVPAVTPAPPAAALFGLPQPIAGEATADALPAGTPIKTPAAPKTEARPVADTVDAAAAATLLIAVATPTKPAAPAAGDKGAGIAEAGEPDGNETAAPAIAVPVVLPATAVAEAPVAATVIAAAIPTADKPLTEKASKPAAAAAASVTRQADAAPVASTPAEVVEATRPQPVPATRAEPGTAKPVVDAGAAMTVLFAQPELQGGAPLIEAAKAAPLAERTLDMTSDDQWIAQLAADIAATKSDKGDISFRLMPRHLGRLDVSMLSGDEGVTLKLDTHHEATATIVQAAQPRLVEDLRQQGVRVADAQVTHTPAEAGRQQQNQSQGRSSAPDASHLIETAADQADPTHDERTADRRGRFA